MTEQELKAMVAEYIEKKAIIGPLEKQADTLNTNIKQAMELLDKDEVEIDDGSKVCYSVKTKDVIDEEALIKVMRELAPETNCIKTREYIDTDILESEIYHNLFSDDVLKAMNEHISVKEIPVLTIKKPKKGK